MPIRVRLKEILEEKGLSQRELARLTGLRPNTISHLCSNTATSIYFDTLETICKTLNIRLEELIELS
ncbi:helix-turn-helix transcriptional regulator [Paenibacillus sp. tmac-D7]|uniref:helix-turn-helix domain-containing protein n=1 Tax=Paenibacillus sp. tmac-D7 TaxID=2591462 RepID=UPI001141FF89|nr:helix-turn-helix transcriptional regulator [Paenibacillus sp. tmac-D7]